MLGYLKNTYLRDEKGFHNPGEILFIQKIKELLSNNSGISYSYKIHNFYSILLELKSVIEDYNYGRTNGFILEDVRKEAMEIAKNNLVMLTKQKVLYEMMTEEIRKGLSIDKNNSYAVANSDMDKVNAMDSSIRNLENVYSRLDYLNDTLDLLKDAIQNNRGNDIILLTECVVSSNIIIKRSISSSYLSVSHFFEKSGKTFEDCWNRWVSNMLRINAEYRCFFKVKDNYQEKIARLVSGSCVRDRYPEAEKLELIETENSYYEVGINVPANDQYAQIEKAFSAYKAEMGIVEFATAKVNALEDVAIIYDVHFNRFIKLDRKEILVTLEYKPYNQYPTAITAIKDIVPNILTHRYIYYRLFDFLKDCHNIGIQYSYQETEMVVENPSAEEIGLLFSLLRDETEKDIFLQMCRNTYELLYYRGIELEQILMNALTMKQKIERHRQVLSYQLQRMYRIRNKFVHHSMIDDNIDVLCKHMRVYMWEAIREMGYIADKRKIRSLEELYSYFRMNHTMMQKMIVNRNSPMEIEHIVNGYL